MEELFEVVQELRRGGEQFLRDVVDRDEVYELRPRLVVDELRSALTSAAYVRL